MADKNNETSEVYQFGNCKLDADRRELSIGGVAVTVQPKAFELLLFLIRNRHRAVDKEELQDSLWPRSIVTETALTRCIMKARRAVNDDADNQQIIKTVHGHGYRFIADVEAPASLAFAPATVGRVSKRSTRQNVILLVTVAVSIAMVGYWLLRPPAAISGPVRFAVLPVVNATADDSMDWISSGFMALMNRMLDDANAPTVSSRDIESLAGNLSLSELMAVGSDFRTKLAATTSATYLLGASLGKQGDYYQLTYLLAESDDAAIRRTLVGDNPAELFHDVIANVLTLINIKESPEGDSSNVSNDAFINGAYARAMALYHEGRYEDARNLFDVILEQEPHLFWPRYERALAIRNLRDTDTAFELLTALQQETIEGDQPREQAVVENAIGIIHLNAKRFVKARAHFEKTAQLGTQTDDLRRASTAYQNLGLVEKNLGNLATAESYMQLAEKTYRDMDIRSLPGSLYNNYAGVLMQLGRLQEAENKALLAIENFQLTGNRLYESYALNRLSTLYVRQHLYDDAEDAAKRALAVRADLNDVKGVASSNISLSSIALRRGELTHALQYAEKARELGEEIDSDDIRIPVLLHIGRAQSGLGNPQEALAHFLAAESIAMNNQDRVNAFSARLEAIASQTQLGNYDRAERSANHVLDDTRSNDRQREETGALRALAGIQMAKGDATTAAQTLSEALSIAATIGDDALKTNIRLELADALLKSGDLAAANPHVTNAASERPNEFESLRLQAHYAAGSGDFASAENLMMRARAAARERWRDEDKEQLASYRDASANLDN